MMAVILSVLIVFAFAESFCGLCRAIEGFGSALWAALIILFTLACIICR
jgi:uncharacterized membrane protein YvlD (DUF360 family)